MEKSKLWGVRIPYIIMFVVLVGIYELVKLGISSFMGSSWVSPIILGLIFIMGLIYVDLHVGDLDEGEDILDQYNYIVIDTQNKTTKLYGQIVVERSAEVTKKDLSEIIGEEWEIIDIFPAYILEADPDDSDVNKIKELIGK